MATAFQFVAATALAVVTARLGIGASVPTGGVNTLVSLAGVALTAVVGVLGAVLAYRTSRTSTRLDEAVHAQSDRDQIIGQLQELRRIDHEELLALRTKVSVLERVVLGYEFGATALIAQIEDLGAVPRWRPPADAIRRTVYDYFTADDPNLPGPPGG